MSKNTINTKINTLVPGVMMKIEGIASPDELMYAIYKMMQVNDIDQLYQNKEFEKIINLCNQDPELIYTEDSLRVTLFGRACEDGHIDLVREFLQIPTVDVSKGRINSINEEWNLSGFDLAVQASQKNIIKLLLLNGHKVEYTADGIIIMKTGGIMNDVLNGGNLEKIIEKMNAPMKNLNETKQEVDSICSQVEEKIISKDLQAVLELSKNEPDLFSWLIKVKPEYLKTTSDKGLNFLMLAAYHKMNDLTLKLAKTGFFDLKSTSNLGFTVVDYAISNNQSENNNDIISSLVKLGATDSKLFNLYTQYCNEGYQDLANVFASSVKFFIDAKANLAQATEVIAESTELTGNVVEDSM